MLGVGTGVGLIDGIGVGDSLGNGVGLGLTEGDGTGVAVGVGVGCGFSGLQFTQKTLCFTSLPLDPGA